MTQTTPADPHRRLPAGGEGDVATDADAVTRSDPLWGELFPACAFEAFVRQARADGGWPESDAVKRLAYGLYEDELRRKNAGPPEPQPTDRKGAA